jgi:hypothetical protein
VNCEVVWWGGERSERGKGSDRASERRREYYKPGGVPFNSQVERGRPRPRADGNGNEHTAKGKRQRSLDFGRPLLPVFLSSTSIHVSKQVIRV